MWFFQPAAAVIVAPPLDPEINGQLTRLEDLWAHIRAVADPVPDADKGAPSRPFRAEDEVGTGLKKIVPVARDTTRL